MEPLRYQVWELPEIKPDNTEYRRHRDECPCCRAPTCAALPVGVPSGQIGQRLTAFVGLVLNPAIQSCSTTRLTVKLQNIVTDVGPPHLKLMA